MLNFISYLLESHPKTRGDRRRESAKDDNDLPEKIRKEKRKTGSLTGNEKIKKLTNKGKKYPNASKDKRSALERDRGQGPARDKRKIESDQDED